MPSRLTVAQVEHCYIKPIVRALTADEERAVLAAFRAAMISGEPTCAGYLAGVRVVQQHLNCTREYAGRRAVEIILKSRMAELLGWPMS